MIHPFVEWTPKRQVKGQGINVEVYEWRCRVCKQPLDENTFIEDHYKIYHPLELEACKLEQVGDQRMYV